MIGELIWTSSQWKNQWVCFRGRFHAENPTDVNMKIAVESKYTLYLNGRIAVLDGGLNRGPDAGSCYYDTPDLSPYLQKGENTIAILVWYWGNAGRCNFCSGHAGLCFEIREAERLLLCSGSAIKAMVHPAYKESRPPLPSYLYGGDNITFDAREDLTGWEQPTFDDSCWDDATVVCSDPTDYWGELVKRPIPQFAFGPVERYTTMERQGEVYVCTLPHAAHVSPYLRVRSHSGSETIDIRTDRYAVHGGPGDDAHTYNSQRVDYITRSGEQSFTALNWYFGEKVIYTIPEDVEVLSLGYIESQYACTVVGSYQPRNREEKKLIDKATRTLLVCMRDNFMDCPDRERGQWIGDVSSQVPQVFHVLSNESVLLVQKAIRDFIRNRDDHVLRGNVPGVCSSELPSQSLNAISEVGMIAEYYKHTGDRELLAFCYQPMLDYLNLWTFHGDGTVISRPGNWAWFDHLRRIDDTVLENCWYASALRHVITAAGILGRTQDIPALQEKYDRIRRAVNRLYWKPDGYRSREYLDDRANALAVLSHIAGPDQFETIRHVLVNVREATPYMEYYVLKALCEMGYKDDAYQRMMSRYRPLIENENSTLWEDFAILGTRNHAWSGGPLTILYEYFQE